MNIIQRHVDNALADPGWGASFWCDCIQWPVQNSFKNQCNGMATNKTDDIWFQRGAGLNVSLPECTIFGSNVPSIGYIGIMVGLLFSVEDPVEGW